MTRGTNVATFYQTPGYDKFVVFCTECEAKYMEHDPIASPAHIIPPMEDDEVPDDGKDHTEGEKWQPVKHKIPNGGNEATTLPSTTSSKEKHRKFRKPSSAPVFFSGGKRRMNPPTTTSSKEEHRICRKPSSAPVFFSGGKRGGSKSKIRTSTPVKTGNHHDQLHESTGIPGIAGNNKQTKIIFNLGLTPIPTEIH